MIKILFKFLSVILSLSVLSMTFILGINAKDMSFDEQKSENASFLISSDSEKAEGEHSFSKMHFYLDNEMYYNISDIKDALSAFEYMKELHSNIILNDPRITVTISFNIDYTSTPEFSEYEDERERIIDEESELDFRMRLNASSKEYHNREINKRLDLLSNVAFDEMTVIEYSNSVQLFCFIETIDIEELFLLTLNDEVSNISLSFEMIAEGTVSWNNTLKSINAYDIVTEGTNTGKNVKVGVFESGGVCDVNDPNLLNKDITLKNPSDTISDHATKVTSIVALMAPEAKFYEKKVEEIGVQWFLDNYCSVINCSFAYYSNIDNGDGTYSEGPRTYRYDIDAIYDYQIKSHFVTVVIAAGNYSNNSGSSAYNPNHKVASPALAYNAITVGGLKRTWSWFQYHLEYENGACYVSSVPKVKPEVSAIYTVNIPNWGDCSGTSFAAPQVTGGVALLIKSGNGYSAWPERVKSAIISNSNETHDYTANIGNFCNTVGAGSLDVANTITNTLHQNANLTPSSPAGTEIISINISLSKNQVLNAGLASIVFVPSDYSVYYSTDYDIKLYNSSNTLVASCTLTSYSNVELIRYKATEAGTYRLVVYQFGAHNSNNSRDWLSLTYNY